MNNTLTDKMTAIYEKDFNSRYESEIKRPLEILLGNAPLCKELLSFTATVPLAQEINYVLASHLVMRELKKLYIDKRLAEATNFIVKGTNNGT